MRRWWAKFCHRLAVRSRRACPECATPILPLQPWAYFGGEVYHWPCLAEKLQESDELGMPVYVYGELPR